MALAREIMGSSLIERSSFVPSSKSLLGQRQVLVSPFVVPLEKNNNRRVVRLRKSVKKNPVAAISEDLVKPSSSVSAEKAVRFKVRAVVTVRNKIKEDFKETIVKHLDAITDRIGRNVVLELVSTEIDPSKILTSFLWFLGFSEGFSFWVC